MVCVNAKVKFPSCAEVKFPSLWVVAGHAECADPGGRYLAVLLELSSRRVVGGAMDNRMTADLEEATLAQVKANRAFALRQSGGFGPVLAQTNRMIALKAQYFPILK